MKSGGSSPAPVIPTNLPILPKGLRLAGLRQAHVAAETDPIKLLGNLAAHRLGDGPKPGSRT